MFVIHIHLHVKETRTVLSIISVPKKEIALKIILTARQARGAQILVIIKYNAHQIILVLIINVFSVGQVDLLPLALMKAQVK